MSNESSTDGQCNEQEQEALDANLLEIELLYRSRCISVPHGTNVIVREIEKTDNRDAS